MRKSLSLSALLSSLLATPLLAAPPVRPQNVAASGQALVIPAPADLDIQFHDQLQALREGASLDAHGMQTLHRQIATNVHHHLVDLLNEQRAGRATFYQVQAQPLTFSQIAKTEKAAFLGVTTSPVTPTLREQLKLARGMGLVIDFIEKESPADRAGFKVHDVLQKLDDQWLINPQQLAVLIRAKKAGDEIPFTLIRGGETTTLKAQLAEKELPVLESLQDPNFFMNSAAPIMPLPGPDDFSSKQHIKGTSFRTNGDGSQVRTYIDDDNDIILSIAADGSRHVIVKDRAGNLLFDGAPDAKDVPPAAQGKLQEMLKNPSNVSIHVGSGGPAQTQLNSDSITLSRTDDDHQISIHINGKGRTLTVREVKTGKVLFDGSITSDEDLKELPPAVQEKVRALSLKAMP